MTPPDTPAVRPRPACWGKTFEHHARIEMTRPDSAWWRCPACDTLGDGRDIAKQLASLGILADEFRAQTARIPVILLPSDATPGLLGHFAGYEPYRALGIPRPLVAV